MANQKRISELPIINTLSGSAASVIPVVVGGTTNQISAERFSEFVNAYNATTSSNNFIGNQTITGNLVVSGDLTAERYYIETISSSVIYESGSTEFGNSGDDVHTFTGSIVLNGTTIGLGELNAQTASQDSINFGISVVTSSIDSHILGVSQQTASQNSINSGISAVTGAFAVELGSVDSHILGVSQQTASQDLVNLGISSVTGSLIGITNGLMAFTASLDTGYATDEQLYQLYQATRSLEIQTGSQNSINSGISAVTGAFATELGGIQNNITSFNNVFGGVSAVTGAFATELGSIDSHILGISTYTSSQEITNATKLNTSSFNDYTSSLATTGSNTFWGNQTINGSVNISNGLTASLTEGYVWGGNSSNVATLISTASIISQSAVANFGTTLYSNRPLTTNFSSVGSIFLGQNAGKNATNADSSVFLGIGAGTDSTSAQESFFVGNGAGAYSANALRSNFIGISAGASATNASNTNMIGYGVGQGSSNASYSNIIGWMAGRKWIGNGIGQNNIIIGTNVTLPNDVRDSINIGGIIFATGSYFETLGSPFSGSVGNGRVGINKVFPQFNLDISGSVGVTGSLITTGGITGSLMATNGVVSSSTQVQNYDVFALNSNLYNATGSLIGITNGLMAFTASLDNTYATDAQLYQLYQATASIQLATASLNLFTGSLRDEVNGIESYTASLKGAIEVSGQNVNVLGMITAQQFNVTFVSSSVMYQSGSTKFGDTSDDIHEFTGSKFEVYNPNASGTMYAVVKNNRARNAAVKTTTTNGSFIAGTSIGTDTFQYQIYDEVEGVNRVTINSQGGTTLQGAVTASQTLTATKVAIGSTVTPTIPLEVYGQQKWFTTPGDGSELRGLFNPGGAADDAELTLYKADGTTAGVKITADGIDFSANANAAGMTSELLDDYEKGTFTPQVADAETGGNVAAAGTFNGVYTKIGNQVTVVMQNANIDTTGMTSGNDLWIRNLPFTSGGFTGSPLWIGATRVSAITASANSLGFQTQMAENASAVRIMEMIDSANSAAILVSSINSGASDIWITLTYFTN